MYTDSFNSEVNSINKYNKIITLRGMDYVIPDYLSSYHQYLTLEQLTLKLGEQSIVAGGDVSYLILDKQRCSASSLSLSIESKHCCALNDFPRAIFFLYREGEEHPITSFEGVIDTDDSTVLEAADGDVELSAGRYLLVGGNVSGAADSALANTLSGGLFFFFDILSAGMATMRFWWDSMFPGKNIGCLPWKM